MKKESFQSIIQKLNEQNVRYLVAGGLAVVAHGSARFTADVDLILDLRTDNVNRALQALSSLGYVPRAPVALEKFADPEERRKWVQEKKLTVFSLFSLRDPSTEVDLFVESPLDFEAAYKTAYHVDIGRSIRATFVGIDDLISLKTVAGRVQDMSDIEELKRIRESRPS